MGRINMSDSGGRANGPVLQSASSVYSLFPARWGFMMCNTVQLTFLILLI